MSDINRLQNLSESLIKMHVSKLLQNEQINPISGDQKQQLKDIVQDLQQQVNNFMADNQQEEPEQETPIESPLRQKFFKKD